MTIPRSAGVRPAVVRACRPRTRRAGRSRDNRRACPERSRNLSRICSSGCIHGAQSFIMLNVVRTAAALQFMNLADILVDAFCNRFPQSPVCCRSERSERSMRKPAVILTLTLAFQLTHCATAVAHEKWFHQGQPTNWSEVLETRRLAAISAVVCPSRHSTLSRFPKTSKNGADL